MIDPSTEVLGYFQLPLRGTNLGGRQIHDRVTTLGTGVDGGVRRISTTFEVRGMRQKITSWNGENVGSGSVVNEVQFAYNEFGQITADYQAHGGTVNTSTTPKVQYGYAGGSANTIRPTTVTYPNGRVITYGHGVTASMSDALSRMAAIIDDDAGSTHLADYSYLGAGLTHGRMPTLSLPLPLGEGRGEGFLSPSPVAGEGRGEGAFAEVDYTEPDIEYTLVGTAGGNDPDTGDIYRGLDRFGRVKDCYWYNYGTSTDVDRIKYGYDRNGSRIWRENVVARSYGKYLDEKYVYDLIDRLKTMDRGALDSGHSTLDNLQFAQRWGLDATGNWRSSLEDSDGDASWNLDQTRTSNKVNEIADITESTGPSWATPAYNPAGNMTTIPKPADPTQSFTATYDAWKRLVKLEDTSGTVAQYEYDGAKRRTVKKTYVSGQLDETRHFFYTEPVRWQVIEERVGTSSNRDRHFVWGLRYIDDLILRDRDTNDDGTLDERLCGMQDANWNVTSIANHAAAIQERYAYHGYGSETAVTAAFAPRGSSIFDWETAFAGYRWDGVVMFFHVRNRLYAASIGNWLQRDPLLEFAVALPFRAADPRAVFDGFARIEEAILSTSSPLEGNNPYVYVSNNSLNRVDPLGLCVCRIPAAGLPPLLAAPPPMPGAFPGQRLMAVARGGQCWAGPPPSLRPWRLCLHPLNEIYCRAVPPACSIFMLWTWSWVWGLPPWGVLGWVGVTWDSCPPNPL